MVCEGKRKGRPTSPSNRWILKLRLLILRLGDEGKQFMQFVSEYIASMK
jgi:hypothetical protein